MKKLTFGYTRFTDPEQVAVLLKARQSQQIKAMKKQTKIQANREENF